MRTTYAYDDAGRMTGIRHYNSGGGVMVSYAYDYDYDAAGRVTARTTASGLETYGYDAADQLTAEGGSTTFGYDATGNRTNSGYATTTGNRTTSDGTWTYTYDAAGNVTKKSKGASSDTWVYSYDHNNQLLTGAFSATDGGAATKRVTYAYDAYGNRIVRQAWEGAGTTTTRYGVDGWDPGKAGAEGTANFDVWVQLDGANALVARYTHGPGLDEVVSRQGAGGGFAWYLGDNVGSLRRAVNNAGTLVASANFSAYGQFLAGTLLGEYGYAGREWDDVLGTWYVRARVYDAEVGRFLSEDPKGFAAGDENLYRYVGNSPTNANDPSGMWLIIPRDQVKKWEGVSIDWVNYDDERVIARPWVGGLETFRKNDAQLKKLGFTDEERHRILFAFYGGHVSKVHDYGDPAFWLSFDSLASSRTTSRDLSKHPKGNLNIEVRWNADGTHTLTTPTPPKLRKPPQPVCPPSNNNQPNSIASLTGVDNVWLGFPGVDRQSAISELQQTVAHEARMNYVYIPAGIALLAAVAAGGRIAGELGEAGNAPGVAGSPFSHLRPGWTKHIDSVVDDLVASGRPKTVVLGEGGQGPIRSFVNREPSKMTEFLEMRPNSLDYTAQAKAGTLTPAMEAETLEFNLLMIERLHQRGFTFKVIGVESSATATSSWLKAELQVLERLGVKWEVIPKSRVEEVMKLPKWR